jgi:hypothetical protein
MRHAWSMSRWMKGAVVAGTALAIVGVVSRGRVKAQSGLTGTWSGPFTVVKCAGDFTTCQNGTGTALVTISDTGTGFTGQTDSGDQIDGYYANQSDTTAVLVMRQIGANGFACSGAITAGMMVVDLTQNTLTASLSGIDRDCHSQTVSATLTKQ